MKHDYEFLNEHGSVCCSTDDIAQLCTKCKVRFAERCAVLAETPEQKSRRLTRENTERFAAAGLPVPRAAAARDDDNTTPRVRTARTARTDVEWLRQFGGVGVAPPAPPSGYASVRQAADTNCPCQTEGYDPYGTPPDPYARGLAALRASQAVTK